MANNSGPNTPITANQVPDHSILDINGKQTYLGNGYILPAPPNGFTLSGTAEVPIALIRNPVTSGAGKALFLYQRKLASTDTTIVRFYSNPTVSNIGIQTIGLVADVSGSLNNTYFLLNDANNVHKYYVWFNINSAGTDPAIPGRTGVPITGATNASAATLGGAVATAIAALNSTNSFTTSGTTTVTVTNKVAGPSTAMVDGAAPTGFTFTQTAGLGAQTVALNLRPASTNTSVSTCYLNPAPSNNGTFVAVLAAVVEIETISDVIFILDPGQSLLVTAKTSASPPVLVFQENIWYEL